MTTKRQKAYQKYLRSPSWIELREAAVKRDKWQCVRCSSKDALQVHHRVYRGRSEDTLLRDLETLCRKCHRLEHGIGPNDFDELLRKMTVDLLRECRLPSPEEEMDLVRLSLEYEARDEVEGFFRHVAGMRIILTNGERWNSWLKKDRVIKFRLWPWSRNKFDRLAKGV